MNSQQHPTAVHRSRLLKASAGAAAGVVIVGVGGTVAAAVAIAHQQTATIDDGSDTGGAGIAGTSGSPGRTTSDFPGLSSSNSVQHDGGSNGS
jgi:hypothetical protein